MRKKLLTTDSTLCGYIIMPVVCTLYGYQDSALNHMWYVADLLGHKESRYLQFAALLETFLCSACGS